MSSHINKEILKTMIGKTIKRVWIERISQDFDDEPFLFLEMTDGTIFEIIADYGGYTGDSEDEYPRFITIKVKR